MGCLQAVSLVLPSLFVKSAKGWAPAVGVVRRYEETSTSKATDKSVRPTRAEGVIKAVVPGPGRVPRYKETSTSKATDKSVRPTRAVGVIKAVVPGPVRVVRRY